MSDNNQIIAMKLFNDWEIFFIPYLDSISIKIQKNFSNETYFNNFHLGYFKKSKFFPFNLTIKNLIDIFRTLIQKENLKIFQIQANLKLIFFLSFKEQIELNLLNLNQVNNNIEQNKQNQKLKLKLMKTINISDSKIRILQTFPSGNILLTLCDRTIKIYNQNLNNIETIENCHENCISSISIIDENNFISSSYDKSIKFWKKKENKFTEIYVIQNAHNDWINKVLYLSYNNIISCGSDSIIKIWEKTINNNFQCISILNHSDSLTSILFLKDKHILISCGWDGTKIWNYNNLNLLKYIKGCICYYSGNSIGRINEDKIIIAGTFNGIMKIISIKEKKVIKEINNGFHCNFVYINENKKIFITGGACNSLKIYRNDIFECIQIINYKSGIEAIGIVQFKNQTIASFTFEGDVQIWTQ